MPIHPQTLLMRAREQLTPVLSIEVKIDPKIPLAVGEEMRGRRVQSWTQAVNSLAF